MRKQPDIKKTCLRYEFSCLKRTEFSGKVKVCAKTDTGTDKLNIVAYKYQNNLNVKNNGIDLIREKFFGKHVNL